MQSLPVGSLRGSSGEPRSGRAALSGALLEAETMGLGQREAMDREDPGAVVL